MNNWISQFDGKQLEHLLYLIEEGLLKHRKKGVAGRRGKVCDEEK